MVAGNTSYHHYPGILPLLVQGQLGQGPQHLLGQAVQGVQAEAGQAREAQHV